MTQNSNKPNGLKYSKMKTTSTAFEVSSDAEILKNAPTQNAWFIAYLFHRVVIGRVVDKQFVYYKQDDIDVTLSNVQKLRVFNKDAELFVWRTNKSTYNARLRTDGEGEKQGMVDARQVMFGTEAKPANNEPGQPNPVERGKFRQKARNCHMWSLGQDESASRSYYSIHAAGLAAQPKFTP